MKRWLGIIGIGEDGLDGLSGAARALLAQAELVIGGARHLALAGTLHCPSLAWPSPLTDMLPEIVKRRGQRVCVLASGDPFFYGVGSLLRQHVAPEEMLCLPAPSAYSLVAARLGWSLQHCSLVSLHGRAFEPVLALLQPRRRIIALSWDAATPIKLAQILTERGMGNTPITLLEAMGGAREKIQTRLAKDSFDGAIADLNTLAFEVVAEPGARVIALGSGLADAMFEHDGQITKREIRAITLSSLRPWHGQLLWDVGAGSGSVGIEWLLLDRANRAIAIEEKAQRAARIASNAANLGVPQLQIVSGLAPAVLAGLPKPDAIFVGGGVTNPGLMEAVVAALPSGARLVVNAVTLQAQEKLLGWQRHQGGELINIQIGRVQPLGAYHGWRQALPVMQWLWDKP